jgi:hypothetical protein
MGERISAYRVLLGKPEEKRPLRRPKSRWEDNTKIDVQYFAWVPSTTLAWLRIR